MLLFFSYRHLLNDYCTPFKEEKVSLFETLQNYYIKMNDDQYQSKDFDSVCNFKSKLLGYEAIFANKVK